MRDSKPSVPLAILMSSAVRIKAMRVELKWTVLSSATGRSIRSSLCGRINQGEQWENWEVSGVQWMWNLQVTRWEGQWVGGRKGEGEQGEVGVEGAVHSICSRLWLCLSACNKWLGLSSSVRLFMLDFQTSDSHQVIFFSPVLWYERTCECKGIKWKLFFFFRFIPKLTLNNLIYFTTTISSMYVWWHLKDLTGWLKLSILSLP